MATTAWRNLFLNTIVHHVVVANSDHMGLLVDLEPSAGRVRRRKRHMFRFEHVWVHEEGCEDVISGAWLTNSFGISSTPMYCLVQKIKDCRV